MDICNIWEYHRHLYNLPYWPQHSETRAGQHQLGEKPAPPSEPVIHPIWSHFLLLTIPLTIPIAFLTQSVVITFVTKSHHSMTGNPLLNCSIHLSQTSVGWDGPKLSLNKQHNGWNNQFREFLKKLLGYYRRPIVTPPSPPPIEIENKFKIGHWDALI